MTRYIITTNGDNDYTPLNMVLDILDYEGPIYPDEEQDKEILKQFAGMLSNQTATVYTEKEFEEKIKELEKMKGLLNKK